MRIWEYYQEAEKRRASTATVPDNLFNLNYYNSLRWDGIHDRTTPSVRAIRTHNRGLFSQLVNMRANSIASAITGKNGLDGLRVVRPMGQNQTEEVEEAHPWVNLLRCPNQARNPFDIWKWVSLVRDFVGTADFILVRDSLRVPVAMYEVFPEFGRLQPVADGLGGIEYFVFHRADGERTRIDKENVLRIARPDPISPYDTASLLQAGMFELDKQLYSDLYERDTLKEGRFPPVVLSSDQRLNREQAQQYGEHFMAAYMGAGGHTKAGIPVMGNGLEAKTIGLNAADIALIDSAKLRDEHLYAITGVHKGLLSENATEANAKAARISFHENTIQPEVDSIAEALTHGLTMSFGADPGALQIAAPNVVPVDQELQGRINEQRMRTGQVTINDLLMEAGKEAVPEGNERYIGAGLVPVSMMSMTETEEDAPVMEEDQ